MLDLSKDLSIIRGPPGTGKTTAIAAFISTILSCTIYSVCVIAESNNAIRNVGEKLIQAG